MDAFIYDIVRTPRGKGTAKGSLAGMRPIALVAQLMTALSERIDAAADDVILGCVTQTAEQGANLAKTAALYAGWPASTSGMTLSRFCASSISSIALAGMQVSAGGDTIVAAGGVESMSRVPMFSDQGPWFADPDVAAKTGFVHMGVSADLVATLEGIERAALDAYALRSHRRAAAARDGGAFQSMIAVRGEDGTLLDHDELIRDELDAGRIAALEPAFAKEGARRGDAVALERFAELERIEHRHTIATSPGLADAAALAIVGSADAQARIGRRPRARILATATASADPVVMLTGNVEAVTRAAERAHVGVADIDRFEINESFAAVPIHFGRTLDVGDDRLNVHGGALAMGHPLGATGGVLIATLLDELERSGTRLGAASICGGAGVAAAIIIERCA